MDNQFHSIFVDNSRGIGFMLSDAHDTYQAAWTSFLEYSKSLDYDIFFVRCTTEENGAICHDFGSHVHFLYVYEGTHEEAAKYLRELITKI